MTNELAPRGPQDKLRQRALKKRVLFHARVRSPDGETDYLYFNAADPLEVEHRCSTRGLELLSVQRCQTGLEARPIRTIAFAIVLAVVLLWLIVCLLAFFLGLYSTSLDGLF